jgi:hypothetical protein
MQLQQQGQGKAYHGLTRDAVDYYQMSYNDTARYGNPKVVECAHTFFGADCILLGVDFPLGDTEHGGRNRPSSPLYWEPSNQRLSRGS